MNPRKYLENEELEKELHKVNPSMERLLFSFYIRQKKISEQLENLNIQLNTKLTRITKQLSKLSKKRRRSNGQTRKSIHRFNRVQHFF